MASREPRTGATLLSFVLAIGLLLALLYVVGVTELVAVLVAADVRVASALVAVVLCWIGVWSGSLRVVLRIFDLPDPPLRTFLVYASMMFWDNVTPLSTVAADPLAAGVLSEAFDIGYERSLAVVVTVDFLNFVPSPVFAVFGLVSVATTAVAGDLTGTLLVPLGAGLVLVTAGSVLGWRYRRELGRTVVGVVSTATGTLGRVVPGVEAESRRDLRERMETLLDHLETIAARRRALAAVLVLATSGWGLLSLALWLSLYAVGLVVPLGVALVAVPLVTVVELVPLPGGVGGLEPLLVLLLAPTTGGSLATVTAGVLLFRLWTHWFPIVLGGATLPVLVSR